MSYLALARKWRPRLFSEVIGQEHVVSALSNALNNQRVHHAFLFTGTRGVGKTTLARIFAKALNCEKGVSAEPCGECAACTAVDQGNFVDLIEVDAASRTRVDDTRDLLDNVQYTPSQGRYKIYLIDEVHMLSTHSFNALLKTLEEPPEHVKFLLATTNPQKLPTTILSRCIQFNLRSMDIGRLAAHLENILKAEEIAYESQALMILSRSANGSVRDALSLLDQAIAFGNGDVSSENVRSMLGMIDDHYINALLTGVLSGDGEGVLATIASLSERTVDYGITLDELISLLHNVSLYLVSPQAVEWKGIEIASIAEFAESSDPETLQLLYQIAIMGKRDLQYAPDPQAGFEMVLLRMVAFLPTKPTGGSAGGASNASKKIPQTDSIKTQSPDPAARSSEKEPVYEPVPPSTEVNVAEASTQIASAATATKNLPDSTRLGPGWVLEEGGWQKLIDHSRLSGISREILMSMAPLSVEGNIITTTLDRASRHLFNSNRIRKIEEHLDNELSLKVRFKVKVEEEELEAPENLPESPTRKAERVKQEMETEARQAFTHDPNVQDLVELFDADIVSDSIQPGKQGT